MKLKKILIFGIAPLFLMIVLFTMNTYTSSPGFTSEVYMEEFFTHKPTCWGIDVLLNKKTAQTDAARRSLCIGYLRYDEVPATTPDSGLTTESIISIQKQIDQRNKNQNFPTYPNEHTPKLIGVYDGMNIEERYWCSDACPDNGILYLNLASSTEESCDELGGKKLYKQGWKLQYVGCSPTENKYSD